MLTPQQVEAFDRDGFILVENVFTPQETEILMEHSGGDDRINNHKFDMPDVEGRSSKLALWTNVQDDVWGAVTCNPRIVVGARQLLREDIYHWHSKVMLKEPRTGGAWEWHQDYGYWYHDGCLYPRMISCLIALNPTNRENGCLKVLVGSHLLGRLDHGSRGKQTGTDPERIEYVESILPVKYVEAPAGSALFFHCNTLHASEANESDKPRISYICCYNALSNVPYGGKGHGKPEPIQLAEDDAILSFATASAT